MHDVPGSWISVPLPRPEAELRLLCFPHAGGGTAMYSRWAMDVGRHIEVLAVRLPARENRLSEKPVPAIDQMAVLIGQELQNHQDKPYAFFGHSMGALLAYEVMRYVRCNRMQEPLHLFAAAYRAPHMPQRFPSIHDLPDPDFLNALKRYNGLPNELLHHGDVMKLLLPAIRADFAASERYRHMGGDPFALPITVLGGSDDSTVSVEELQGWRRHTSGRFALRMFEGGHFFVKTCDLEVPLMLSRTLSPISRSSLIR